MKLFYPNLSFEDELANGSHKATPASAKAVSDLAPLMAWAADAGSVCLVPEQPLGMSDACVGKCVTSVKEFSESVVHTLQPWGWTEAAISLVDHHPLIDGDAVDLAAVRTVNSRSFLNHFDEAVNLQNGRRQLFSHLCRSIEQVSNTVTKLQAEGWAKWVAKPELSHAGRNRLIVTGTKCNLQQAGWLNRLFERGEAVCIEPWVHVLQEGSLHFDIRGGEDDSVQHVGMTGLLNDGAGRYRGSFRPMQSHFAEGSTDVIEALLASGTVICQAIQQTGYWGPVGLDFFVYSNAEGQRFLRLCNDLNARWTMGRLSLAVADRVGATGAFRWEHFVTGNSAILDRAIEKALAETGKTSVAILRTSPDHVGGRDVRLGNVAIWEPESQYSDGDADCIQADCIHSDCIQSDRIKTVAQQIRSSIKELLSQKSSQ